MTKTRLPRFDSLLLTFFIISNCLSLLGCQRSACFSIENEDFLNPGYPIQFRNCSEHGNDFRWDFGDGGISYDAEPTHTYAAPGDYNITLSMEDRPGQKVFSRTLSLQYRSIDYIRILSMSPTKPNGAPWDPDGSGPDLFLVGLNPFDPPGFSHFTSTRVNDVVPPQNLPVQSTIIPEGLTFLLMEANGPSFSDYDTVDYHFRSFEQLADSSVETIIGSSVVYEIHMR